ncbi:MAG: CBS domain-containing protein, partial [Candidatus Odinarchaeota archaeon]|nr:CBS domain-containing protein [Candidatus Odinarchaeota archaeon]
MSESDKEAKVKIGDLNIQDEYVPVAENITAREAAQMMRDYTIPDLVVVDESEKPLGVITESILVREILADPEK